MLLPACSMDKLFDLMMMGYKYQIMCCTALQDMLQVSAHASTAGHARAS
jgi:hypothetical protein